MAGVSRRVGYAEECPDGEAQFSPATQLQRENLRKARKTGGNKAKEILSVLVIFLVCLSMWGVFVFGAARYLESSQRGEGSAKRPGLRSKLALNDPHWEKFHNLSIVYTWVNGSDPTFKQQRSAHGNKGDESRYRETEELVHSLRSMERFMPWHTGEVILVTPNGVWPSKLDRSHPRLRVIDQYDIIPENAQPAFNSAVVEQCLFRIPGLTEIFIHMNDDYLFGRLVHPSDFITDEGGPRLFYEPSVIRGRTSEYARLKEQKKKQWLASVFHTVGVFTDRFDDHRTLHFVKHAPFVYSKQAFVAMHRTFTAELAKAIQMKFRNYDDILVPFLHHLTLMEFGTKSGTKPQKRTDGLEPINVSWDEHSTDIDLDAKLCYVRDDLSPTFKLMEDHIQKPYMFLTVNDGFSQNRAAEFLRSFLQRVTPYPSQFELPQDTSSEYGKFVRRPDVAKWVGNYATMLKRCELAVALHQQKDKDAATLPLAESYDVPDPVMEEEEASRQYHMQAWRRGKYVYPAPESSNSEYCPPGKTGLRCNYEVATKTSRGEVSTKMTQKTYNIVPGCEAVDVVFTWVNGSDPTLRKDTARLSNRKEDSKKSRTRDFGQLRYGLRAVRRYLPWVRHIWVVSGTPAPAWLDTKSPYVTYVPHKDLFEANELPQLNSNSIQSRLHKIPDLAMRFISLDDDFMFLRPVTPREVLGASLTATAQGYTVPFSRLKMMAGPYRTSVMSSVKKVMSTLTAGSTAAADAVSLSTMYSTLHLPTVVDRVLQESLQAALRADYTELATHKFRQADDLEPLMSYTTYAQALQAKELAPQRASLLSFNTYVPTRPMWSPTTAAYFTPDDLACRMVSSHPSRWSPESTAQFEGLLRSAAQDEAFDTRSCVDALLQKRLRKLDRGEDATEAGDATCLKVLRAAAGVAVSTVESQVTGARPLTMLKDGTDFGKLVDRLQRTGEMVTCLNDDFTDQVCERTPTPP